jgi:hypothetical protein
MCRLFPCCRQYVRKLGQLGAEAKLFLRYHYREEASDFPEMSADEVRYLIKITSF